MPVSFGLRNEDNERINNVLKQLIALTFVPEGWNGNEADALLKKLSLELNTLNTISAGELNGYLTKYNLDWANMELFADVLVRLSATAGNEGLTTKAASLYNYVQAESKMFSFEIMNKINTLR